MPARVRPTQDQRLYNMVTEQGVDAAIDWFKDKGKKAAWGGTTMALAQQLIKTGHVEEGLQFMELEVELSPGKTWLLRKAAEACLSNGKLERALALAEKGLAQKPDDEKLQVLKAEAAAAIKSASGG